MALGPTSPDHAILSRPAFHRRHGFPRTYERIYRRCRGAFRFRFTAFRLRTRVAVCVYARRITFYPVVGQRQKNAGRVGSGDGEDHKAV